MILKEILDPIVFRWWYHAIVKYHEIFANILNHDLHMIYQWAHQWKMEFNPDHTKQATEVLFSCKKVSSNPPRLKFQWNRRSKSKWTHKRFGLILQPGLPFEKQRLRSILEYLNTFRNFCPHLNYYHIPSIIHQLPLGMTHNSLM